MVVDPPGFWLAEVVVVDVELPPVERLTCLLPSCAKTASISCAGTADAEIMASSRNVEMDQGCILKVVFVEKLMYQKFVEKEKESID